MTASAILRSVRSRHVLGAAAAIALLMVGSAFYELEQSRRELLRVLQDHAVTLAQTVERSGANVVLAADEVEEQWAERLLNNATSSRASTVSDW